MCIPPCLPLYSFCASLRHLLTGCAIRLSFGHVHSLWRVLKGFYQLFWGCIFRKYSSTLSLGSLPLTKSKPTHVSSPLSLAPRRVAVSPNLCLFSFLLSAISITALSPFAPSQERENSDLPSLLLEKEIKKIWEHSSRKIDEWKYCIQHIA